MTEKCLPGEHADSDPVHADSPCIRLGPETVLYDPEFPHVTTFPEAAGSTTPPRPVAHSHTKPWTAPNKDMSEFAEGVVVILSDNDCDVDGSLYFSVCSQETCITSAVLSLVTNLPTSRSVDVASQSSSLNVSAPQPHALTTPW